MSWLDWLKHDRDLVGDTPKRLLIHVPVGMLIAVMWPFHWVLPLVFTWLFIRYEDNEDRHTKDQAWKDYAGVLVGLPLGTIISPVVHMYVTNLFRLLFSGGTAV